VLADAKQVTNLPGRPKRDPSDSRWLAACFERGAVTPCFVATGEFRVIRLHTRYRRELTEERTREKQRAEKLLESAAIKLSSVVSDLHGVTGRDIMDHLIAGVRDPKALAQLARARARRKIAELEEALEGAEFFTAEHAVLLKVMLERIDRVTEEIARLTGVIERLLAPYEEQLAQAESMPGWGRRAAQDAVAETGVDMTRFRTGGHLSSWAGKTPLDNQSGKRTGRAKSRKGNRYLAAITGETAAAASKTQTREGARYRRLARRRGKAKAMVATGNTQLKVYHKLLSNPGMRYQDLGADYYERQRDIRRQISHHVGKLGALGFDVTLCRRPEPDPDETGTTQAA
jgi:transposase